MSIPDWPSLWEKEPGLRPETIGVFHDGVYWTPEDSANGYEVLVNAVASVLCRDAAVRWLVKPEDYEDLRISLRQGEWCVEVWAQMAGGEPDMCLLSEVSTSLDDALFAVCKAAIQ